MKIKLQTLFLVLMTSLGFSQTDIEQLHSAPGSEYVLVTGSIDQSPTGGSALWDFTSLTTTGTLLTDTYTDTPPTSTIQTSEGMNLIGETGLDTSAGVLSITSVLASGIQLNYSDFAIIGTFPLSFGYSNTDGVEGTFTTSLASGNVLNTSTINVDVDAWGDLKVGTFDGSVTRLKIIQNLNLLVGGFVSATGTQTAYFYYDANSNDLVFRTTRIQVNSALGNIDESAMESLSSYTLSTNKYQISESDMKLQTNPVQDVLRFVSSDFIEIKAITISDISGRIVLETETNESSLNVSQLTSGIFLASISTNRGVITKKFIKK